MQILDVKIMKSSLAVAVALSCGTGLAMAQAPGGVVTGGSSDTLVNGKPAVIVGGRNGCGGVVTGGSSNVFINGKPVATAGSQTGDCKGR
jgi:uncharacterized Zn-binding protein involved in type VI secretion